MPQIQSAPRGLRLHIGIFGRRNAGKSSLLNGITAQNVSIVSDVAGTTTDPVEKPMELLPLGPVLFIDTAGIDDVGTLGEERANRARLVFDRTELAILVLGENEWTPFEDEIREEFARRNVPVLVVFNKTDLHAPDPALPYCTACLMDGNSIGSKQYPNRVLTIILQGILFITKPNFYF